MRIQHNIMAMNAYRNYSTNTSALSKNLEKLSSGYKINRAGDDAAGLAISEKMRAQITGLDKAQDNAKDGISLVQTAEGALTEVHDMLNRMYSLAEQSANGTYDQKDRDQLQKEVNDLRTEINRIADSANFNGINLLDGSMAGGASVSGQLGTANVEFSIGSTAAQLDGTNSVSITVAADSAVASGISVTIGDTGVISVKLSSKAAASYTADEITQAVRDAAQKKAEDERAGGNDASKLKVFDGLSSFTMKSDGVINVAANDKTTTGAKTFLNGDGKGGLTLQIGDTGDTYNQLNVTIKDCHAAAIGIADLDIGTQQGAKDALKTIEDAINYVSDVRGTLGATQNRLDHTINNLSVMQENIQDAESTIRDTDVADEMMAYTKNNILIQSAQAMLAQANQVPQGVLQLLQ
ncbi:MAG: flagellin [Oscillospiraceae bacterium]|nr:flagellin [Oscillospiraceae bacterium]